MNTAQASRLVFEHLLKYDLKCKGVSNSQKKAALGVTCQHNLTEEHDVVIPNMEANPWLIYKSEIVFMELPEAHIKEYRNSDSFVIAISTLEGSSIGIERTLLKAKLTAFAMYVYNGFTNEQIAQFQKENA